MTDKSMDAVAEAYAGAVQYECEDGSVVTVRKATVKDYPLVLKVVRSVVAYVDSMTSGAVSSGDVAKAEAAAAAAVSQTESVINLIEDNLPLALDIIEKVTSLSGEEVNELTLGDLVGLSLKIWEVNQRFFIQTMGMLQGLGMSTPQPELQPIAKPAKRVRKR